MTTKEKLPPIDVDKIRDVSEKVYRARLSGDDAAKMEAERPGSVRRNAGCMDVLTRVYMEALGIELPRVAAEGGL
jgi:hypothetical protein